MSQWESKPSAPVLEAELAQYLRDALPNETYLRLAGTAIEIARCPCQDARQDQTPSREYKYAPDLEAKAAELVPEQAEPPAGGADSP